MTKSKKPTKNPTKQRKPSVGKGGVPTPPGFEAHPERRHNGAWKKEDTPRFKLEQMMKMSESELMAVAADRDAPYFERKLAKCINAGNWREIESMINQVYGVPKQIIEQTNIEPPKALFDRSNGDDHNDGVKKDSTAKKAN